MPRDNNRPRERAWLDEYKVARGCVDCGYNAHPRALDFDHVDGTKAAGVNRMVRDRRARSAVLAEIAKCEVVCANCHRVRTWERGQHWSSMGAA